MRYLLFAALIFTACACHNPNKEKIEKLLQFVKVEGGSFSMGSTEFKDAPPHQVELSSFYMQKTEVTQELWQEVMGSNPSSDKTWNDSPVTNVSWEDCQKFIKKLNATTGKKYRLPTEAEWEYAARGGKLTKGYKYSGSSTLEKVAWCSDNSNNKIHAVAEKKPNELGLFDMSGNVYEWCSDWEGEYRIKMQKNPKGPDNGRYRVLRGGSYRNSRNAVTNLETKETEIYDVCNVAYRGFSLFDFPVLMNCVGFRLALTYP